MAHAPRYSLPMPFGWFALAYSSDLAVGQVSRFSYFDTELVAWRGEDGAPRALDPYCPHMGAHLGVGGTVIGNDLQCPFHHWRYNGEGAVTAIPYTPMIPPVLRRSCTNSWPIAESNDIVYVWYHPEKAAPLWELASVPELESGEWTRIGRREWTIAIHTQEITENGSDFAHFASVHGTKSPPEPEWKISEYGRESMVRTKMETPRGLVDGSIGVRNTGPGQSFIRFGGISELLTLNLPTPIDQEHTHVRQEFYVPVSLSEGGKRSAAAVMKNVIFQLEQDIPIWENKKYQPRPLLVRGDGPILAYRRQYAKYYVTTPDGFDAKTLAE